MNLLEIKNLKMDFSTGADALRAVDGVSLTIGAGEPVCLVGESGCGKTVTVLSIARLVPTPPANYIGGEILLNGRDVLKMSNDELAQIVQQSTLPRLAPIDATFTEVRDPLLE